MISGTRLAILPALALIMASAGTARAAGDAPPPPPAEDVLVDSMVKVPMRDGKQLSAWVFRAPDAGRLPVILAITPYSPDDLFGRARYFSSNGYHFVIASTRGRADSEGELDPFGTSDGRDAHDLIEWIARQAWSDGKVGMWGGSYVGYNQWAAAGQLPSALKTIVPTAAVFPGIDYPNYNGVPFTYPYQWLAGIQGRHSWFNYAFDDSLWTARMRTHRASGAATRSLAALSGSNRQIAERWADQPDNNAYWQATVPSDAALQTLDIPALTITGHFDADQLGSLSHYRRYRDAGPRGAANSYLLIGPWDHAGTRNPTTTQDRVTVSDKSVIDLNALHKAWYDWTMKGGSRPEFLKDRVTYFTMGADEWRSAPSLDEIVPRTTFYLGGTTSALSIAQAGTLSLAPIRAPRSYAYEVDTADTHKLAAVEMETYANEGPDVAALDGDGLVFETPVFVREADYTGAPEVDAWISLSRPDADFFISVYEVAADGELLLLSYDVGRARYRDGLGRQSLHGVGKPFRFRFRTFTFSSKRIAAGSRLRLAIHSNPPLYLEKNFGAGGRTTRETALDGGKTVVRLHNEGRLRSLVKLPVSSAGFAQ
jgi:hypothetical protein